MSWGHSPRSLSLPLPRGHCHRAPTRGVMARKGLQVGFGGLARDISLHSPGLLRCLFPCSTWSHVSMPWAGPSCGCCSQRSSPASCGSSPTWTREWCWPPTLVSPRCPIPLQASDSYWKPSLSHLPCCHCARSSSIREGLCGALLQLVLPKTLVPTCCHMFPFQVGAGGLSPALHRLGRSLQQAAADTLRGEHPPLRFGGTSPGLG